MIEIGFEVREKILEAIYIHIGTTKEIDVKVNTVKIKSMIKMTNFMMMKMIKILRLSMRMILMMKEVI
jgi:hypothetical protein